MRVSNFKSHKSLAINVSDNCISHFKSVISDSKRDEVNGDKVFHEKKKTQKEGKKERKKIVYDQVISLESIKLLQSLDEPASATAYRISENFLYVWHGNTYIHIHFKNTGYSSFIRIRVVSISVSLPVFFSSNFLSCAISDVTNKFQRLQQINTYTRR